MSDKIGLLPTIPSISAIQQAKNQLPIERTEGQNTNFATMLKSALEHVNHTQHESNAKTQALAQGKIDDLHDVMITAQKASITLTAAVEIQQKVIDAYSEMMRMQV